jgi:glycosyltransferase involved in cell wall biosynthesis/2-polyprenyl-3-methyl-5-hydroxy-6-metoxy-1,4-benzoquinol methylase
MIKLQEKGYRFNPDTGIWVRDDYQSLCYSDGDENEERVARIIREAEDLSVLSTELNQHCTDWPSLYHLGAARGNILRPFESCLSGRVLEVGAGCGAISRYLGECGGSVLSLEGSLRRAQIAAVRTRDLPNVMVVAERFDDFDCDERFDVITLIGVLEYSSMFSGDANAALNMLKRVHEFLSPEGKLILAIENQLGLKYFAGAPEDHLNVPMYGIEGRYINGQPQTFGRKTLESLIKMAGFDLAEFLYPAPDYKLPNSITTEHGFELEDFDAAALAWQNVKKDPQLPRVTGFNLERTWPVVIENGLGSELANSFLVVASGRAATIVDPTVLAYHYNTHRKPALCKETRFVRATSGIEVHHAALCRLSQDADEGEFRHRLSRVDTYVKGTPLSQRFLNIATTPDWTIDEFGLFLNQYLAVLKTLLRTEHPMLELTRADERLPDTFIDAVPHNIVIALDGTPTLIDVEWEVSGGVELGHLLLRSLLLLIANATPFHPSITPLSRQRFVLDTLRSADITVSDDDLHRYIAREAQFQAFVTGRAASEFLDWKPDQPINQKVPPIQAPLLAKLYYSNAEGEFTEQACIAQKLVPGYQQLHFAFSRMPSRPMRLRLDPVDQMMSFALDNLRLLSGRNEVWAWDRDVDHLLALSGLMKIDKSGGPVFFLSLDDDPYLELSIDLSVMGDFEGLNLTCDLVLYTTEEMAQLVSAELNTVKRYQEAFQGSLSPLTEQIQALRQSVEDLEKSTGSLAGRVAQSQDDAAQGIERVESLLVDHRQVLTQQIGELDKSTHSLADSVVETEHETIQTIERLLGERNAIADDREAQIAHLQSVLHTLQVDKDTYIHLLNLRISELESSFGYRLAAPVRHSIIAGRRIKRVSILLPSMIQRGGGLRATASRTVRVLRQQGMKGIVERIRWFSHSENRVNEALINSEPASRHDYEAWIKQYDTLDAQSRWQITEHIRTWENPPLISIIMPVFDPPLGLLREAIHSVRYQLYPNWELCIADDASTNPEVRQYLEQLQLDDPQVKVVFREQNGHICAASNSAIDLATGDYLALMDNDDLIAEHALYWVTRTILENPDVGLIYSDEDKIDLQGKRSSAYFKPDWNEFLFRSQNMISHLGVYKRSLVKKAGGFRVGFEGAQDYDLALRCVEQLAPSQIIHIPRVLYHWRAHVGSTALATDEKPYAFVAGVKALDEHLQRQGIDAFTELLPISMYRVRYELPEVQPLISLIIPTRNAHGLVKLCIDSIRALTTYKHYEIILVDNGSDEPESLAYFAELALEPRVTVLRDEGPFNFSALNNRAVSQARGELIGLVNNDIEVITPQWLEEMVSIALQPGVGAVGARLWFSDDRLQHGGVILGVGGVANHSHKFLPKGEHGYFGRAVLIQSFSAVTAACLVIRKSIYEEVGGLDEVNLKIAFNDVDFCLRVQEAGYTNVWTPFAELYHHESVTRGLEDTPEKQERFVQEVTFMATRWPDLQRDIAYNPNLTLDHHDFGLAWPPRV